MSELLNNGINRRRQGSESESEYEHDHLSSCRKTLFMSDSSYSRSQNIRVSQEVPLHFLPCSLAGNRDGDGDEGGKVCCLALSDKLLFTASTTAIIHAWELPLSPHHHYHHQQQQHHPGHADGHEKGMGMGKMGGVKVMKEVGEVMVSGHEDCKIRMWKREPHHHHQYKLVATLPTLKDYLLNLIPPSTFLKVRRHQQCLWVEHADAVSALATGRINHERVLYSGSWDRTVKVWRMSNLRCIESFYAHDDAINTMAVSPADGLLYTGSADTTIKVWKWCSQKNNNKKEKMHSLVATLKGHKHKSSINALALISSGTVLYSGSSDRTIIVWGRKDDAMVHMVPIAVLSGHRHAVLCLAIASCSNYSEQIVCSGSADKTIRLWRCKAGVGIGCSSSSNEGCNSYSCLAVLGGHDAPIKFISCLSIAQSPSSPTTTTTTIIIYSNSLDYQLKMWALCIPLHHQIFER